MPSRRGFLKCSAAALLAQAAATSGRAQPSAGSVSIMTWGGLWGDSLKAGVDTKFQQVFSVPVVQDRGSSPVERIAKIRVNVGKQLFDLVQLHDGLWPLAIAQDAVEPLASRRLSNAPDLHPGMVHSYWVAQIFSATGICYNTKEVKNPPASWADLWRPEFRGRIVLPEISHSIGTYIIPIGAMAAGKDPKDADAGFDMFARMVKLDPIFARDTDTMMSALATGEAVIGILYKSQTYTVLDRKAPVAWVFPHEGAIAISWGTGIARGCLHPELAEKYIDLTLDAETQTHFARAFNYAGSNKKMLDLLDPTLRERVQLTDAEIARLIALDHGYMSQSRTAWVDRWNRAVAGR